MKNVFPAVYLLSLSTTLSAAELYVQAGAFGDCSAVAPCGVIQQAIDVASAGDQISIGMGYYVENLTIKTAGLSIVGAGDEETRVISAGGD